MPVTSLYYILAGLLMLAGIVGIVLPALPGLPLVFAGMLLAAWAGGFEKVGAGTLVALGLLTLLSMAVDFLAATLGARRAGASRLAIVGAMIGTLAGAFFGPVGLFVGPFVGALGGELMHGRRLDAAGMGQATRVGFATWLGLALGIALKLMLALAMVGLFAWAWFH
ncbi:MAG: hypothetical protein JWL98_1673 [Xanthomonadaceae bacterium]|nr:hypothetical protein [Xanthomonadaceae bacterium]